MLTDRYSRRFTKVVIAIAIGAAVFWAFRDPSRSLQAFTAGLGKLLQQRTLASLFSLGALNGLLPCGLVYAACISAVAFGGILSGLEYMLAFGLGTVPMMLGIGLAGKRLHFIGRWRLQKFVPVCLLALGVLLVLRGMALGIPGISPNLTNPVGQGAGCH
jgi:uncharacterized protein